MIAWLSGKNKGLGLSADEFKRGKGYRSAAVLQSVPARAILLDLSRHRLEVGKMGAPLLPLFVDGAIDLTPVHPVRRSSQECCSDESDLILGMTAPNE